MSKQQRSKSNLRNENLRAYEPLVDYFENNDIGELLANVEIEEIEVNLKKHTYVINVNNEIAKRLSKIASFEGISSIVLLQRWLGEKVSEYKSKL